MKVLIRALLKKIFAWLKPASETTSSRDREGLKMSEVMIEVIDILTELNADGSTAKVSVKLKGQRVTTDADYIEVNKATKDIIEQIGRGRKMGAKFFLKFQVDKCSFVIFTDQAN